MRFLTPLAALLLTGCANAPLAPISPPPAGVTYAWATFDANGVRDSGAAGVADRGTSRTLTAQDPVRIASVSKLFVALGVMRLVEQGKLDLDSDVSRWLGWQLRNPAFPDRPITLRMLLSHTSSIKDEGDNYVIPLGKALQPMATDAKSFDAEHAPGSYFRYSNLNFPIVGSVVELATGERFDRLMDRLVMKPLGLDACFNWTTCSDTRLARAVVLYRPDGSVARDDLRGKQPDCPVFTEGQSCKLSDYVLGSNGALFSPQGGVRASPTDLAVVGQLLLNDGRHRGERFLGEASVQAILRPLWTFNGSNGDTSEGFYCAYGLASQTLPTQAQGCRDDLFGKRRSVVGHAGDAYGVRSGLWVDRGRSQGIAYFAANNPAEPAPGRGAYLAVEEWLAARLN
jgi:CubicO group peptidase (beta-lactamase class C family)